MASRRRGWPAGCRTTNLALLCPLAALAVFLLWVTLTALRLSDVSAFFVLAWWGTWLLLAPRAVLRLAAALSDLRTGPVVVTGQVVQRRAVQSDGSGPGTSTENLSVVAVDVGGGTVNTFAVDNRAVRSHGTGHVGACRCHAPPPPPCVDRRRVHPGRGGRRSPSDGPGPMRG